MADFCNICISQLANGDFNSEDIGDILLNYRLLTGGDINITEIFDKYIKDNINNYLSDETYAIRVGGICEHCGLVLLSVKKDNDILYLVAWCLDKNDRHKYKIAIINDKNELEYQPEEIIKLYNGIK